ncbi:5001_t:CDS:2 [Cetraspora pellucida]|uniref:5001_t:CDS:1 n=1 Tax=Cetraspora pellucida TaxID=1433469 RepID=A0A9N9I179_9GLOM|nr:5001_t:CDS:2 [Cetraspora pellucida]
MRKNWNLVKSIRTSPVSCLLLLPALLTGNTGRPLEIHWKRKSIVPLELLRLEISTVRLEIPKLATLR